MFALSLPRVHSHSCFHAVFGQQIEMRFVISVLKFELCFSRQPLVASSGGKGQEEVHLQIPEVEATESS